MVPVGAELASENAVAQEASLLQLTFHRRFRGRPTPTDPIGYINEPGNPPAARAVATAGMRAPVF